MSGGGWGANWKFVGYEMRSWGPVGEAFEGHGAQDAHFGGPNDQNLKNLRLLNVFRGTQI